MRSVNSPSKRSLPSTKNRGPSGGGDEVDTTEHDDVSPSASSPIHNDYYDNTARTYSEANLYNISNDHVIRNDGAITSDMHYASTTRHRRPRVSASSSSVNNYQQYDRDATINQQQQQPCTNSTTGGTRARNTNHIHPPTTTPEAPTLGELSDVLQALLKRYLQQFIIFTRRTGPKIFSYLWKVLIICIVGMILLQIFLWYRLFKDATDICTPPSPNELADTSNEAPLVEYYVHGHGNGHYARSVAIVEQLLEHGIDIRMFIGRATMWRAVNAVHSESSNKQYHDKVIGDSNDGDSVNKKNPTFSKETSQQAQGRKGVVTVISVSALLPSMSNMDNLSLIIDRVLSDCETSKNSKRYPMLVITDGDMPGMFRAKFGSIPSVGIAHGQTFVVGKPPLWVRKNSKLKKAWSNQHSLNIWSSRFTNWQIGTNFVDLPTNGDNAVIARSPMRPEILEMANERHIRRKFGTKWIDSDDEDVKRSSTDVLLIGDNKQHRAPLGVKISFMTERQKYFISELLLGADISSSLSEIKSSVSIQEFNTAQSVSPQPPTLERRKLVICYFRDKNGDVMTNALLRSGFDVLLFERGYHKGLSDTEKKKFGQEWIVHREHEKHSVINSSDEETLDSYWKKIVHKYNRKLLEDDDTGLSEDRQDSGVLTNTTGITPTKRDKRESNKDDHHINQSQHSRYDHDGSDDKDEKLAMQRLSHLVNTDSLESPRIIRVTDMSLFVPLLSIADGVASSAGSQLLSECIYANVPILALYRENDDEQMLNIQLSRHRFENENVNVETIENVVHGISLEKFTDTFSSAFNSDIGNSKDISDKIMTESEEAMFIRTATARRTYDDFNAYVESVRKSKASWSYYYDLFYGVFARKVDQDKDSLIDEDNDDEYSRHDPFKGMPEASGVILEIIKQVIQDQQGD